MIDSFQEIDSDKFQESTDPMVKVVAMLPQKLEIELLTLQDFLKELNKEPWDPSFYLSSAKSAVISPGTFSTVMFTLSPEFLFFISTLPSFRLLCPTIT